MSMHFAWDAAPQITTHLPPDVFSAEFVSECFWCQGMILFEFQTPFPCLNRFVSMYFRSSTEYCNTMQYYTMHVATYLTCAFEIHQRGMKRFCSEMFELNSSWDFSLCFRPSQWQVDRECGRMHTGKKKWQDEVRAVLGLVQRTWSRNVWHLVLKS